jgi:hypothetical protein
MKGHDEGQTWMKAKCSRLFRDHRWLGRLTSVSNTCLPHPLAHHGGRQGRQKQPGRGRLSTRRKCPIAHGSTWKSATIPQMVLADEDHRGSVERAWLSRRCLG